MCSLCFIKPFAPLFFIESKCFFFSKLILESKKHLCLNFLMQRWSLMKPSFMFLYLQVSPNLEPAPSLPPAPSTFALLQTAQKNLSQSDDGSSLKQNSTVNSTIDLVVSSNSSDADRDTATRPPQAGELDTFTVSFISIFCATHFIQTCLF